MKIRVSMSFVYIYRKVSESYAATLLAVRYEGYNLILFIIHLD